MEHEKTIEVKGILETADSSPSMCLIFSTICFCFWANTMGFLGKGALLAIGCLQIAVFVGYTVGAKVLLDIGNGFGGNTFMIFAAFFGGIGGIGNTMAGLAEIKGFDFCYQITGIAFIMAGLFLFSMLPKVIYIDKVNFFIFLFGAIGVTIFGLTGAGLVSASWNTLAAWSLFLDGLAGSYYVVAVMYGFLGNGLSLGKPFLKKKEI